MLLPNGEKRHPRWYYKIGIILLVLGVAGIGGALTGNWLSNRNVTWDKARSLDEDVGLGKRTGLTGDLGLQVSPMKLTVNSGQPIKVELILTNETSKSIMVNKWFTLAPADFEINQLPLKVIVTKAGRKVPFLGNAVLYPPHNKKDFIKLRPGWSKEIPIEISRYPGIGKWDMSAPGEYTIELWYETYLTGKYVGVKAWTGMTNHVIVQVMVRPPEGGRQ